MTDNAVIKIIFIFTISLMPFLVWWLILPKVKQRWQSRLRRSRLLAAYQRRERFSMHYQDDEIDFDKYFIGNTHCRFNAHSPYIRCAVNPGGPCDDCSHYEPK